MNAQLVYLIDDDAAVLDSLSAFFRTAGYATACFSSAENFLIAYDPYWNGCVVLDVNMPGKSGLELQQDFISREIRMPVIFISAHHNVGCAVQAMRSGAVDFLLKPLDMARLLEHVEDAFERNRVRMDADKHRVEVRRLLACLTGREKQVLDRALAGESNKEIALALGISYRTVEAHRAHILNKADVKNIFELSRLIADPDSSLPLD